MNNVEDIKEQRERIAHDPAYGDISYRDKISTIRTDGSRNYIHPKLPKGKFTNWRKIVGYFLLALLVLLPVIKINGDPAVMLNFLERKFVILGVIFWPQDTFIMMLMMVSFLLFIILFTVTYGRIFCGWACPQTIFLELIFRPIEVLIEGKPAQQRKLNEGPWNANKIGKKSLKTVIFYVISFVLVNVILWYFMGFDKWLRYAQELDKHSFGLILIFIFSTAFFGIYSWFREQICLIACPYGRMQGVLIDPTTIVISYDYLRGEPRGHQKKGSTRNSTGLGDCIDCHACVEVCPTGIDIRNGNQLECVNCTACIDACDGVMDKVDKPKGLIRYASEKEISTGIKQTFSVRTIAYSVVLLLLLSFFVTVLVTRSEVEAVILRTPGMLYQEAGKDSVLNLYNIKGVNKTRTEKTISLRIVDFNADVKMVGGDLRIPAEGKSETVVFIKVAKSDIANQKFKINIEIISDNKIIDHSKVTFIAPN